MKIKAITVDGEHIFDVVKVNRDSARINYKFNDKIFSGFQFDDAFRPSNFVEPYRYERSFRGYLIAKKGYNHLECNITLIKEEVC